LQENVVKRTAYPLVGILVFLASNIIQIGHPSISTPIDKTITATIDSLRCCLTGNRVDHRQDDDERKGYAAARAHHIGTVTIMARVIGQDLLVSKEEREQESNQSLTKTGILS
jgi:hypothetical protein